MSRCARVAAWLLLASAGLARAQTPDEYQQPVHIGEDEIAIAYLAGRFTSPITCKRNDGSVLELQDSIVMKPAPEEGGGNSLKVTFFGVDVADVDYCYNLIEKRVPDRRGSILLHYRSHNRKDLGASDFRREAAKGSLTYNAHRGEVHVRGLGKGDQEEPARDLQFDGGDSRMVLEPIQLGSDGAKLFADYDERVKSGAIDARARRFALTFYAKDGSHFTFYGIEDKKRR